MDTESQPNCSRVDEPEEDSNPSAETVEGIVNDKQKKKLSVHNKPHKCGPKEAKEMSESIKEKRRIICKDCGAELYSFSKADNHRISHQNLRNFSCQECGKSFLHKHTLKEHLKIHLRVKKYNVVKSLSISHTKYVETKVLRKKKHKELF